MLNLTELQQKLKNLKQKRFEVACSDDFAYTNGKIKAIDAEINRIKQQILEKTNEKS